MDEVFQTRLSNHTYMRLMKEVSDSSLTVKSLMGRWDKLKTEKASAPETKKVAFEALDQMLNLALRCYMAGMVHGSGMDESLWPGSELQLDKIKEQHESDPLA